MNELEMRLEDIKTPMDVAVMGCIVNGPGEAKVADIGLTGASPSNLIYRDGKPSHKVNNENLVDELERQIREKAAQIDVETESGLTPKITVGLPK